MTDTENIEGEFCIEDYCKIAAAVWAVHARRGNKYTVRLVHSVLRVMTEALADKQP